MVKILFLTLSFFLIHLGGKTQEEGVTFKNFTMGGFESEAFTTNSFTCIGVGKGNRIWAGTQYGGLYTYDQGFNIWQKSSKLTNVFINDIKADADSGIWIAQSGTQSMGGNSNIAGGVNYFSVASDISMEFYSVLGTTTFASLQSRNARSLYIDQSFRQANGRLPRPWVAQGTFISSSTTRRGGINVGLNGFVPYFYNVSSGLANTANATPICETIGGNSSELWVGVRQNFGRTQIVRYTPSGNNISPSYDYTNVPEMTLGFTPRAIFFDRHGNRWIGMSAGGLLIKTPEKWERMDFPNLFPPGTAVNTNAIAEDEFGNVFIGTSSGLIKFKSPDYNLGSTPSNPNSYLKFTTLEGLPHNNITGLAYDKKNHRLLITTSGGVSFMNAYQPYIKGVVYNVWAKLNDEKPYSGLQKSVPEIGATVNLWDGFELVETAEVQQDGIFELKEAEDDKPYKVEVIYRRGNGDIRLIYNNVFNHTLMQPSLVPDGIIKELKALKPTLEERCFTLTLPFNTPINAACRKGFILTDYEKAQQPFLMPGGLQQEHDKQVQNIADYLTALATLYQLGGNSMELNVEAYASAIEAVQYLVEQAKGGKALKDFVPKEKNPRFDAGLDEQALKMAVSSLKLAREMYLVSLKTWSASLTSNPEAKKVVDKIIVGLADGTDILINLLENGQNKGAFELVFAQLKKLLALQLAVSDYRDEYCLNAHADFVPFTSNASSNKVSSIDFETAFDALYNPNANSLVKEAKDVVDLRKQNIDAFNSLANIAGSVGELSEAATALGLIPGGQAAAGWFKVLSIGAKFAKVGALGGSVYNGAVGFSEIIDISKKIKGTAGFEVLPPPAPGDIDKKLLQTITLSVPQLLIDRKTAYHQKLNEINAIYKQPGWNPVAFGNKYKELFLVDSLFSEEITRTLNGFWPYAQNAMGTISGFQDRNFKLVDSIIFKQYQYRNSFYYLNMAYLYADDKVQYLPGLDSLVSEIKIITDSLTIGLGNLIAEMNSNAIQADAFLVKESYTYTHSHLPGSTGTVSYTFKNYGPVAQQNVRFKVSAISGGYTINGPDSFHVASIPAGGTTQVSIAFTSPMHDSLGKYMIDIEADNGTVTDVSGSLFIIEPGKYYTVKAGNWNDPLTWSGNLVPSANHKVHIGHPIIIDANVSCKSLTASPDGTIDIKPGRKLTIVQ